VVGMGAIPPSPFQAERFGLLSHDWCPSTKFGEGPFFLFDKESSWIPPPSPPPFLPFSFGEDRFEEPFSAPSGTFASHSFAFPSFPFFPQPWGLAGGCSPSFSSFPLSFFLASPTTFFDEYRLGFLFFSPLFFFLAESRAADNCALWAPCCGPSRRGGIRAPLGFPPLFSLFFLSPSVFFFPPPSLLKQKGK